MLSSKEIVCPNNLLDVAHKKKGVKVAVVNAGKPLPMLSVQDAVDENLIEPIFIGDKGEILKVRARSNSKFLLISGKPIKEQIARGGPFVMNTREEVSQAVEDYHAGRFVK